MPSCTLSPDLVNLPSGISTNLPPNPRKPPVLRRMALTLPSAPAVTLCTEPSLLPSEENTLSPIIGFFAGAADCLSVVLGIVAGLEGFMAGPVDGVGAGSGLTAGGVVCVSGAGVCVWALAASAAALETTAAAPIKRRRVSIVMRQSPYVVAARRDNPLPAQRLRRTGAGTVERRRGP